MTNKMIIHSKSIIFILFFALLVTSCSKDNYGSGGNGIVKINLLGTDNGSESLKAGQPQKEQKMVTDFDSNHELVATLTPVENTSMTKSGTTPEQLGSGIVYNVVVYDQTGAYVTEKPYISGQEGNQYQNTISLSAGTYTFVCYSVGSTNATDLPTIDHAKSLSAMTIHATGDQDLMFFRKDNVTVAATGTTYLNVLLRHKFSSVTVGIGTSVINKAITAISNQAALMTQYNGATLSFNNGSVAFPALPDTVVGGAVLTFPSTSSDTITSNPRIMCTPATTSARIIIPSMTIGGVPKTNLSVGPFTINPETKYILHLSVTQCYTIVNDPPTVISQSYGPENGTENSLQTITLDQTIDAGFELDIYDLDNSFDISLNGQEFYTGTYNDKNDNGVPITRTTHEINFQGWDPSDVVSVVNYTSIDGQTGTVYYPPNIKFQDGSKWEVKDDGTGYTGYNTNIPTAPIFMYQNNDNGTVPSIKVIINADGTIEMYGTKVVGGPTLFPLSLVNGETATTMPAANSSNGTTNRPPNQIVVNGQFNAITWNNSGTNTINIKMLGFGNSTRFYAKAYGRKKVPCSN